MYFINEKLDITNLCKISNPNYIYQWRAAHGCYRCGASLKSQNLKSIFIPCNL